MQKGAIKKLYTRRKTANVEDEIGYLSPAHMNALLGRALQLTRSLRYVDIRTLYLKSSTTAMVS